MVCEAKFLVCLFILFYYDYANYYKYVEIKSKQIAR